MDPKKSCYEEKYPFSCSATCYDRRNPDVVERRKKIGTTCNCVEIAIATANGAIYAAINRSIEECKIWKEVKFDVKEAMAKNSHAVRDINRMRCGAPVAKECVGTPTCHCELCTMAMYQLFEHSDGKTLMQWIRKRKLEVVKEEEEEEEEEEER